MRAVQITGKEQIEVREIPVPGLFDEKSILIKNEAVGVCAQTDLHIFEGTHIPNGARGTKPPFTLGHEVSGIVVKAGREVTDVQEGDRVSLRGWFCSGGYADYTVANVDYIKIPQSTDAETGALLELLTCTYIMAEQVLRIADTVVILGHGAAGTYFNKLAKAGGASLIIVSEPNPHRRQYALELGADHVIDPNTEDVLERVKEFTNGEKCDTVIEAAGFPGSIAVMPTLVRRRGRIGMFGVCTTPTISNFYQIHENATAVFSAGYHLDYTEVGHRKAFDLVDKKIIDISDMVTQRISLEKVPEALAMVKEGKENIRKIMVKFD